MKATVSGIYITKVTGVRGPLEKPEGKKSWRTKLKEKANQFFSNLEIFLKLINKLKSNKNLIIYGFGEVGYLVFSNLPNIKKIIDQNYIKENVIYNIKQILLSQNRGWIFEEIEGTSRVVERIHVVETAVDPKIEVVQANNLDAGQVIGTANADEISAVRADNVEVVIGSEQAPAEVSANEAAAEEAKQRVSKKVGNRYSGLK